MSVRDSKGRDLLDQPDQDAPTTIGKFQDGIIPIKLRSSPVVLHCKEIDFKLIHLYLANITAIEEIEKYLGGLAYVEVLLSIAV